MTGFYDRRFSSSVAVVFVSSSSLFYTCRPQKKGGRQFIFPRRINDLVVRVVSGAGFAFVRRMQVESEFIIDLHGCVPKNSTTQTRSPESQVVVRFSQSSYCL